MKPRFLFVALLAFGFVLMGADGCSSDPNVEGAKLDLRNKDYDRAMENLEEALATNPQNAEAWMLKGDVLQAQAKEERDPEAHAAMVRDMAEAYQNAAQYDPELQADVTNKLRFAYVNEFQRGITAFNAGQTDDTQFGVAAQYFGLAAELQPDSAGAYTNQAFAFINAGQGEQAIEPLQKAVDMGDDSPDNYVLLADLHGTYGQPEQAVAVLETASEMYPSNPDVQTRLLNAMQAAGRMDEAMDLYAQYVANEPDNKLYRYNYGSLLLNAEQFDDAIEQLQAAVDLDADYGNAWYNLGAAYVNKAVDVRERLGEMDDELRANRDDMSADEVRAKEAQIDALTEEARDLFAQAVDPLERAREILESEGEDASGICQALFQSYVQVGENDKARDAAECAGIDID